MTFMSSLCIGGASISLSCNSEYNSNLKIYFLFSLFTTCKVAVAVTIGLFSACLVTTTLPLEVAVLIVVIRRLLCR